MAGLITEVAWMDDVDAQDGIPKGPVLLRLNIDSLNGEELDEVTKKFAPGEIRTLVSEDGMTVSIKINSTEQKFREMNAMGVVVSVEPSTPALSAA